MLTFYIGSFFIGLFFALLTRGPIFFPSLSGMTALMEFESKKVVWDTIALKLCFFVNSITSSYLVTLQTFKLYEDNVNLRRIEILRKRIWIFQRVEALALIIGLIVGFFGTMFPKHLIQIWAFFMNLLVLVDVVTIRKLKTVAVGSVVAFLLSMFWFSESMSKFNHAGSQIAESLIDSQLYIGLVRLRPFVGSDYVTMNMIDFLLPNLVYKFMTMLDWKREKWLLANRLLFSSDHPSYAKMTARALLISGIVYVLLTGITINQVPFSVVFTWVEMFSLVFVFMLQDDLHSFLLFGKKLDAEIPNIAEEPDQGSIAELQHVLIDEHEVVNDQADHAHPNPRPDLFAEEPNPSLIHHQYIEENPAETLSNRPNPDPQVNARGFMDQILNYSTGNIEVCDNLVQQSAQNAANTQNNQLLEQHNLQAQEEPSLNPQIYNEELQDGKKIDVNFREENSVHLK